MTISLLLLVFGWAAAADKPSSDTGKTLRVLKRSYMTMALSEPRLDKIITLLEKATLGRGCKDVLIMNILKARKPREKETAAMIKQAVIQAEGRFQSSKKMLRSSENIHQCEEKLHGNKCVKTMPGQNKYARKQGVSSQEIIF